MESTWQTMNDYQRDAAIDGLAKEREIVASLTENEKLEDVIRFAIFLYSLLHPRPLLILETMEGTVLR